MSENGSAERLLNVVVGPESRVHRAVRHSRAQPSGATRSANLAEGFQPQPSWNLTNFGGPTIVDLTFRQ